MKIQLKQGMVLLQSGDYKVLMGNHIQCKADAADIFVGSSLEIAGDLEEKILISSPGEYEAHGVMVQAIPSPGKADILFLSVDVESINIVFINQTTNNIPKNLIEQVGVNNVLIANTSSNLDNVRDLVDDFEPEIFIPFTDKADELIEVAKKLGVLATEPQKSLVLNPEDFESEVEEKPLQLVILTA